MGKGNSKASKPVASVISSAGTDPPDPPNTSPFPDQELAFLLNLPACLDPVSDIDAIIIGSTAAQRAKCLSREPKDRDLVII